MNLYAQHIPHTTFVPAQKCKKIHAPKISNTNVMNAPHQNRGSPQDQTQHNGKTHGKDDPHKYLKHSSNATTITIIPNMYNATHGNKNSEITATNTTT